MTREVKIAEKSKLFRSSFLCKSYAYRSSRLPQWDMQEAVRRCIRDQNVL